MCQLELLHIPPFTPFIKSGTHPPGFCEFPGISSLLKVISGSDGRHLLNHLVQGSQGKLFPVMEPISFH